MGTDIHVAVERRGEDGQWTYVPGNWPRNRNYDAFAILAGVRNGSGFAGVDTGDGFVPIAAPRGLPRDAAVETLDHDDGPLSYEHTPSWITLAELLAYDWTRTTKKRGWANAPTWRRWWGWARNHGESPRDYCGSVDGPNIKHIDADEMVKLVTTAKYDTPLDKNTYALAEWETPYWKASGWVWQELVPRLLKIAGGVEHAADVRIVFDFDS